MILVEARESEAKRSLSNYSEIRRGQGTHYTLELLLTHRAGYAPTLI